MKRLITINRQMGAWWYAAQFILAVIVTVFLIAGGLHPVWGILLFLFRRAAFRVCLFLILLYWLTQDILQ